MKKLVLTSAIVLFTGLMMFAQPHKGMGKNGSGKGYCLMAVENRIPDLTEDQKTKIGELKIDMLKETQPLQNKMIELRAKYHTMMTSDQPDRAAIDKNIQERADLHAQLMKSHSDYRLAVTGLLTEDQKVLYNNPGTGCPMRKDGTGRGSQAGPR